MTLTTAQQDVITINNRTTFYPRTISCPIFHPVISFGTIESIWLSLLKLKLLISKAELKHSHIQINENVAQ